MTIKYIRILLTSIVSLLILLGMASCTPEIPTGEAPLPVETEAPPPALEEAPTPPSPTSSPVAPVIILTAGTGADPWTVKRVQTILEDLALESSLELIVQEDLALETLSDHVRVVVGISLENDPAALAVANPSTAFVFVNQAGASPGGNLSVIGDPTIDQQRQSFMAGYLAALVSSDYKVAGLIPADHDLSQLMADTFAIGAEFFCGVCNPLYPPFQNFPQWEFLSKENAGEGFQPVVDTFIVNGVEVLYIQNDLASPAMLTYLAGNSVKLVGDGTPDTVRDNWVGTVTRDPGPGLVELWPDLLAGVDGVQVPSAIALINTEAGLISEGRLRMFEEMADDLEAGLVSPEIVP